MLSLHHRPGDRTTPPITERTALLCAIVYTVLYVAPFYLSSTLRSTPLQSRDAPAVIRARVRAVTLTCVTCTVIAVSVLVGLGSATPQDVLRLLGVWPIDLVDIVKVLSLVAVLFVGPLYENVVVDGDWRGWSFSGFKEGIYDSWTGYRNLLVAPASEEVVFRSLTISLYLLAGVNTKRIIFLTPLIFGFAHVHHLIEFVQSQTPRGRSLPPLKVWIIGIVRSLFQFTYTSLFGFFAAFVFLRTGNLLACIAAHTCCNWLGVPRVYGKVGQFAEYQPMHTTPDVAQGRSATDTPFQERGQTVPQPAGPQNLGIGWTVVYYALIFGGAYGFYLLLWPLTGSPNALSAF